MKPFRMLVSAVLMSFFSVAFAQRDAPKTAVLLASPSAQSNDLENTLRLRLESLRRNAMTAWQRRDSPALQGIMAPDFNFVSSGGVASREQWLALLSHCSLASYTMDQVQLHSISTDAAGLIYRLHYVGECDGKSSPSDSIVVDTFNRRKGQWWIVNTSFMPQQQ